ncbi:MAG: bifunctional ADP-dependent NAD(P)H-hydrate dehydratase/NAD(P)H-hydrate epimerase, partial [Coriobacteriia bacterium]|nr:bifunctional ADP-dependent NAD(P)H-hydrate dehydratase/NAD(P)H-hydrate epimerase [Coriobacteriia bacterium]
MYRVLTAAQSRAVEERAVAEQGVSLAALMRAAGAAVAREIAERVPDGDIVVLAGPGNNGGDGWVAARELAAAGRNV